MHASDAGRALQLPGQFSSYKMDLTLVSYVAKIPALFTELMGFFLGFRGKALENNDMYAVIVTGGKQYRVTEGETLKVELLPDAEGSTIELDRVLMVGEGEDVKIGAPYVEGGKVTATVKSHGRGDKIRIVKFRRRKHFRKQMGHRQHYTELQITGISAG